MDYASTVWHNLGKDKMHLRSLNAVQRTAMLKTLSAARKGRDIIISSITDNEGYDTGDNLALTHDESVRNDVSGRRALEINSHDDDSDDREIPKPPDLPEPSMSSVLSPRQSPSYQDDSDLRHLSDGFGERPGSTRDEKRRWDGVVDDRNRDQRAVRRARPQHNTKSRRAQTSLRHDRGANTKHTNQRMCLPKFKPMPAKGSRKHIIANLRHARSSTESIAPTTHPTVFAGKKEGPPNNGKIDSVSSSDPLHMVADIMLRPVLKGLSFFAATIEADGDLRLSF
jgi:hypothetical protein